jgi:hypothetical protein
MPTLRHYFKKTVKNALVLAAACFAVFLLALLLAWLLPSNGPDLRPFLLLMYAKEIGIGVAIFTAVFFLFKAYKVCKTERSFPQELFKMTPSIVILIVVFLFSSTYLFNFFHQTDCTQHDYTAKLDGGIKRIGSKTYHIRICGSGLIDSHFLGEGLDKVLLSIMDEQGTILAKRHYTIFLDDSLGLASLQISEDKLLYFDADSKQGEIAIPPTIHDWIGARIPVLN